MYCKMFIATYSKNLLFNFSNNPINYEILRLVGHLNLDIIFIISKFKEDFNGYYNKK